MSFGLGWGVGDILAISGLAVKVYTAYKDAPDDYRHISDEVESLQAIIDKAVRHERRGGGYASAQMLLCTVTPNGAHQ